MQAAHGFVAHHPWSRDAGAVINVEATGSGGPDVLFREAGGWPAATYARAVPHPVTTATIRDLVRFANLPVDTDFSVFADPAERDGNLPGVDLASMLDGYCTTPTPTSPIESDAIRPGVRRERPRRVVRVRRRARATRRRGPRATRRADATGRGRRVFRRLRRRRRRRRPVPSSPPPRTSRPARGASSTPRKTDARDARVTLAGVKTAVASAAYAMLAPAALGAVARRRRGNRWRGSGTRGWRSRCTPVAVMPPRTFRTFARDTRGRTPRTARGGSRSSRPRPPPSRASRARRPGTFTPPPPLASRRAAARRLASRSACLAALALVAPAVALAAPTAYVTFVLISEKVGIAGSEPWPFGLIVGDATMGLAAGAATALVLPPRRRCSRCSRRFARRFIFFVAVTWTVAAAFASLAVASPYSARAPKRLAVLHQHDAGATGDDAARFFVGALDLRPRRRRAALHRAAAIRPTTREDFASMHPVTQLLGEGIVLRARDADRPPWGAEAPELTVELAQPHGTRIRRRRRRLRGRVRDAATGGDVQIARAGVELRAGTGARDGVVVVRDASEDGSVVGATRGERRRERDLDVLGGDEAGRRGYRRGGRVGAVPGGDEGDARGDRG